MPDFSWPKPWLLQLYARAVEEGCIRIKLRGETEAANETEYKSFKASFLRLRRKRDAGFVQMRPEYQMVGLRFERERGSVLLIYNALPDGELLPSVESVTDKQHLPQPVGSRPHPTPEAEPEDFDATSFVGGLIEGLDIEDEDDGATEL